MIGDRIRSAKRFASRLRDPHRFDISADDVVLDLGSGQDPHPRANILCDKFVVDASERSCGAGLLIDRPLVLADATSTPFPDASFDFVFCSHLLEHMQDPAALIKELVRIGRRGYIETPSKTYEKLYGWDFHHWYVSVDNGVLVLQRKEAAIFDEELHDWFLARLQNREVGRFVMDNLEELGLITTLVWNGDIPYRIEDTSGTPVPGISGASQLAAHAENSMTTSQRLKGAAAARIRRASEHKVAAVLAELRCPRCGNAVEHRLDSRVCPSCNVLYPISGLIHVAIPELARPHDADG